MDSRAEFAMHAHKRFAGFGFTQGAQDLVQDSLRTAQLPGTWIPIAHDYADQHGHQMYRSQDGVWGVQSPRMNHEVLAELFISRMAALAGVPVAPVFMHEVQTLPMALSIISFERICRHIPDSFFESVNYLRHHASALPFLLIMGDDNDRKRDNLCVNSGNKNHICEFDFESTDISNAFSASAHRIEDVPADLRVFHQASYHNHVTKKAAMEEFTNRVTNGYVVLREAFEGGLTRMLDLPPSAVNDVLDVIDEAVPVRFSQRQAINEYVSMRTIMLHLSYASGKLDHLMVDSLPARRPPEGAMRKSYSFG